MREKGTPHSKEQVQHSPGVSKEATTDRYETCWEDIAELEITSIQPCPIIPDYKTPTLSTQPIVVRTPEACFCIDGWHFIEQAKAADRSTIRCHISHIKQHSDTELAIRKAAVRVMPQGGKCSYAELVRNTLRLYQALSLYQALKGTSDDLVLFSHGGDRRGVGFNRCRENNISAVLAHRLGKSQTTINKYLQHGDSLNDSALELLVDAGAAKDFFEAFQTQKQIEIASLNAKQIDETAIVEAISKQVLEWLSEYLKLVPPKDPSPESIQEPETNQSPDAGQSNPIQNQSHTVGKRIPHGSSGRNELPAIDPAPANPEGLATELKRIGEALIEIADDHQLPIPQQIETVRNLILELTTLLPRLAYMGVRENGGKGGKV
jgi:hypothetical protein